MSIEERAEESCIYCEDVCYDCGECHLCDDSLAEAYKRGYVDGATKQRDIDIQKACNWLDEHIHDYLHCDGPMEPYYIGDQSLIEDFRKAMKGE